MVEGAQGARRPVGLARKASQDQSRARRTGPVLSVAHAATYLDVSRWTVYRLVESGELRSITIGGHKRIALSDLADYLDRRRAS